eukprot:710222-Pelagomonas_calceolata.AAC.2
MAPGPGMAGRVEDIGAGAGGATGSNNCISANVVRIVDKSGNKDKSLSLLPYKNLNSTAVQRTG